MCKDENCKYKHIADLAAEFARCGIYSTKVALEHALREAGYELPRYVCLYQEAKRNDRNK